MKAKCPNCSTELRYVKSIKSLLCNDCGFTLPVEEEPETPKPPNPIFKNYKLWNFNLSQSIFLGTSSLIVFGIIIGLITRSPSPNTPQKENTAPQPQKITNIKPETQAAISELKGINSKLDVGMNMMDYAEALRNANVLVDRSLEADPQFPNNPTIQKIMKGHLAALKLWRCNLENSSLDESLCNTDILDSSVFPLYPEIKASIESDKGTLSNGRYYYNARNEVVLQLIWRSIGLDVNTLESNNS